MSSLAEHNDSHVWRDAYEVFDRAMDLPASERERYARGNASDPVLPVVLQLLQSAEADEAETRQEPASSRAGTRVGRYAVLRKLGRGAMGQVYAARDSELDREVALKFLTGADSAQRSHADRLIREAKAASALNHPHIVTIYDVVRDQDLIAIAMELVDGESLREFCGTPQPFSRVIGWASQIAQALVATHGQHIVHRDIKPDNLMVRHDGYIKVLDFGLARSTALSSSAKSSLGMAGTLRYMSPEQTRGETPGPHSDIFSFGTVLFELLSGTHPFDHSSPIDAAYAIGHAEVKWPAGLEAAVPGDLQQLVLEMMSKDPQNRPSAKEVEAKLAKVRPEIRAARRSFPALHRNPVALASAGVLLLAAVFAVARWNSPPAPEVVRMQISPPQGWKFRSGLGGGLAVSPDDKRIAVGIIRDGVTRLVEKRFEDPEFRDLRASDNAGSPFFSPDGREIGYYNNRGIQAYSLQTGQVRTIVPMTGRSTWQQAIWTEDGTIYFAASEGPAGLHSIRQDGSNRQLLFAYSAEGTDSEYLFPRFVRGNYLMASSVRSDRRLILMDLSSKSIRPLYGQGMGGHILQSGHLVYFRDEQLFATRLDSSYQIDGRIHVPVIEQVHEAGWTGGMYDISPAGTLAYLPPESLEFRQLVWVDLQGRESPLPFPPASYEPLSISPDGSKIAIVREENKTKWTLFLHNLKTGEWHSIGEGNVRRGNAVWSPDGRYVAFTSNKDGSRFLNVYTYDTQATDPATAVQRVTTELVYGQIVQAWTRHGNMLVYGQGTNAKTAGDLYAVRREDPSHPILAAGGPGFQSQPSVSPNGKWLAYRDCGDICVLRIKPFAQPGEAVYTSSAGAFGPIWSPEGDRLYYMQAGFLVSQPFSPITGRPTGPPQQLFRAPYHRNPDQWARSYALSPDGKRFLFAKTASGQKELDIQVIVNWAKELQRLVP
jgi:serine/threonine protein kinase